MIPIQLLDIGHGNMDWKALQDWLKMYAIHTVQCILYTYQISESHSFQTQALMQKLNGKRNLNILNYLGIQKL